MDAPANKSITPLTNHIYGFMNYFFIGNPTLYQNLDHEAFQTTEYKVPNDAFEIYIAEGYFRMLKIQYNVNCENRLYRINLEGYQSSQHQCTTILTVVANWGLECQQLYWLNHEPKKPGRTYLLIGNQGSKDGGVLAVVNPKTKYEKYREKIEMEGRCFWSLKDPRVKPSNQDLAETNLHRLMVDLEIYNACTYSFKPPYWLGNYLMDATTLSVRNNLPAFLAANFKILSCCKHIDKAIIKQMPEFLINLGKEEAQKLLTTATQISEEVGKMQSFIRQ